MRETSACVHIFHSDLSAAERQGRLASETATPRGLRWNCRNRHRAQEAKDKGHKTEAKRQK